MITKTDSIPKISIRNLYKIFGENPQEALDYVKNGMSKAQLLEEHGHVLGLNNINIEIKDCEITVIMGLSGSGKSTLVRHVNRLIEPTSGEILLDGEDLLSLPTKTLRDIRQTKMSMVFQKFALLPHRTVLENAILAPQIRGTTKTDTITEAHKWLDRVGLTGYEDSYPHQLSGGMQQRVGIARSLISNSEIMLMDEAYSALDPLIRTDMQDLLLDLQNDINKTIIFITHDLDEALKLADNLVILKDGFIVQQGEPQNILLNPCDPYIEDFVSDINRARVLRVCSIMDPLEGEPPQTAEHIDRDDNLESVIALSGGDTSFTFVVTENNKPVGTLNMKKLVKALVPRINSNDMPDQMPAA